MNPRFTVGGALSTSFSVLMQNFVPFMLLGLVFSTPSLLINLIPPDIHNPSMLRLGLAMVVPIASSFILTGALVYGVYSSLRGQRASLNACVSVGISRLLPIIGCALLIGLGIAIGLLLLIVPGVIIMLMWYVGVPCAIIEGTGVQQSLTRSQFLTAGHRGQIFGLVIILGVLGVILGVVVRLAFGPAYTVAQDAQSQLFAQSHLPSIIATYLLSAFTGVLGACASAVVYQKLRQEKEGVDIQAIASVFD